MYTCHTYTSTYTPIIVSFKKRIINEVEEEPDMTKMTNHPYRHRHDRGF